MRESTPSISFCPEYAQLFPDPNRVDGAPMAGTRLILVSGGRGSGKSFATSCAVATWLGYQDYKVLYTRYTMVSADDSVVPEFIDKVDLIGLGDHCERIADNVTNRRTGSMVMFRGIRTSSGNQTGRLKSLPGINAWICDEADEMSEKEFNTIYRSIRDKRRPNVIVLLFNPSYTTHWIYNRWYRTQGHGGNPLPHEFNGKIDRVTYVHTTYEHNAHNLDPEILEDIRLLKERDLNSHNNIDRGHWISPHAGALWDMEIIDSMRISHKEMPVLKRIVVAVDPSGSSKKTADECGICVAGVGEDGHYYILRDSSLRGRPQEWGQRAVEEYNSYQANELVGEVNYGGEMVETVIHTIDPNVNYEPVTASKGKMIRAEPISALYAQGKVHHVGVFNKLECEMVTYDGKGKSPNRMDALVWALSRLMGQEAPLTRITPYFGVFKRYGDAAHA